MHQSPTTKEMTIVQEAPLINSNTVGQLSTQIDKTTTKSLEACVYAAVKHYYQQLGDTRPQQIYRMVMAQVEPPLIKATLEFTQGNQSEAATLLGISRGGLRLKCQQHHINLGEYSRQFRPSNQQKEN